MSLLFSPILLDFGSVTVGNTATIGCNVANNDDFDESVATGVLSDGHYAQDLPAGVIFNNTNVNFNVTFTPTAAGIINATLTFPGTATQCPVVISLTGLGVVAGSKLLSANPSRWDFGAQKTGVATAQKLFTLTNQGTVALTITALGYNGDFSAGATQPGLPYTLNPSATVQVGVKFTPSTAGFKDTANALAVTSDATVNPFNIEMTGTGYLIAAAFSVLGSTIKSLMSFWASSSALRIIDPTVLDSEEISVANRTYDFGLPADQKVLARVYIKYENLGVATITLTVTSANSTVTVNVPIGTVAADKALRTAISPEILVDGDILFIEWKRTANSGPVQVTQFVVTLFVDEQAIGSFAVPKTINAAFNVTGTKQALFAFGNTVQVASPANLASEATSSIVRSFDYNQANGFEDTLLRVFLQYEDLGIASLTLTATVKRFQVSTNTTTVQSVPVTISLGTVAADSSVLDTYADLEISGELIKLQVDRTAGAVSLMNMTHRFIPRGEEVPA